MYDDPPDEVSGNTTDCYICGRNFVALSQRLRECVIKLTHKVRRDDRVSEYFMSVCVWCHSAHLKSPMQQR